MVPSSCLLLLRYVFVSHLHTGWLKPAVPSVSDTRDRFHGRQYFHGGGGQGEDGSGGDASHGKRQVKPHSLPKAHLLLRGPVPAQAWGALV